jgi:hypothetical protein
MVHRMARSESSLQRGARLGAAQSRPRIVPRWLVLSALANFAANALFPRLSYRLRWITRAGPHGLALHVAAGTLAWLGVDALVRGLARAALKREDVAERLRAELGRPPWPEEVDRALR